MMVAGEEHQLRRLQVGGTPVVVTNGTEVAVTLEMAGIVIFEIGVVKKGKEERHLPGQTGRKVDYLFCSSLITLFQGYHLSSKWINGLYICITFSLLTVYI